MAKKVLKADLITDRMELSRERTWFDYLDNEALQLYPGKDDWRKRLIYTMLKWSDDHKSIEVLQFVKTYKIPLKLLLGWTRQYPDIEEAYIAMKANLACNRHVRAMEGTLAGSYAYRDMHMLYPGWDKNVDKYHSDLKKVEEAAPTQFIIVTDKPRVITAQELKDERDNG